MTFVELTVIAVRRVDYPEMSTTLSNCRTVLELLNKIEGIGMKFHTIHYTSQISQLHTRQYQLHTFRQKTHYFRPCVIEERLVKLLKGQEFNAMKFV